ncbi:hypothetical protein TNCV_2859861 [Trichonephila clavipes]|nr:hypothetical protein TNCV_2859861 [Trichonephila clavipes]
MFTRGGQHHKMRLAQAGFFVENVDKTTERIEIDRHVSSRSITQELKINHSRKDNHLSHSRKVGFKKNLDVWVHTN